MLAPPSSGGKSTFDIADRGHNREWSLDFRAISGYSPAMDTNQLLMVFIAVTSVAVLLQLAILIALYGATRKTSKHVEELADKIQTRGLPLIDSVQELVNANRANVDTIVANVAETSKVVKGQLERADQTMTVVLDRTRAHFERADQMFGRTIDRVEHATDTVRRTVEPPVRHINGVVQGIAVGLSALFGRRPNGRVVQKEDHFI
jgi:methyl-accepting chemotaxis protein